MLSSGLDLHSSSDCGVLAISTEPPGPSHGELLHLKALLMVAFPLESTKKGGPAATVSINIKGVRMQDEP